MSIDEGFQNHLRQQSAAQQQGAPPPLGGALGHAPVALGLNLQDTQGLIPDSKGYHPSDMKIKGLAGLSSPAKGKNFVERLFKSIVEGFDEGKKGSGSGGGSSSGGSDTSSASAPVSSGGGGGGGSSGGSSSGRGGSGDAGLANAIASLQGIGPMPTEHFVATPMQQAHFDHAPAPIATPPVVAAAAPSSDHGIG